MISANRSFALFGLATVVLSSSPATAIRGESVGGSRTLVAYAEDAAPAHRRLSKGPKKRECKISRKPSKVEIECKTKSGDKESDIKIKDEIEYKVEATEKGASVKVEYKNKIEEGDVETETETQYEVVFDRLVEFTPTNSDGSFSYEDDASSLHSELPLMSWGSFSDIATSDDGDSMSFTLTSTFDAPPGESMPPLVEFTFTVSQSDEGSVASANKMKIDFRLTDYSWTTMGSNIALMSVVESKKRVETTEDVEGSARGDERVGMKGKKAKKLSISFEEAIEGTGVTAFGEYTWADTALATGNETDATVDVAVSENGNETEPITNVIQVVATSPEVRTDEKKEQIAFSFVGNGASGAQELYWDPEAGIGYESGAMGATGVFLSGLVSTMLLLACI